MGPKENEDAWCPLAGPSRKAVLLGRNHANKNKIQNDPEAAPSGGAPRAPLDMCAGRVTFVPVVSEVTVPPSNPASSAVRDERGKSWILCELFFIFLVRMHH